VFLSKHAGILLAFEDIELKLKYVVCSVLTFYHDESIDLLICHGIDIEVVPLEKYKKHHLFEEPNDLLI
jgi:hypothetical protein